MFSSKNNCCTPNEFLNFVWNTFKSTIIRGRFLSSHGRSPTTRALFLIVKKRSLSSRQRVCNGIRQSDGPSESLNMKAIIKIIVPHEELFWTKYYSYVLYCKYVVNLIVNVQFFQSARKNINLVLKFRVSKTTHFIKTYYNI